MNRIRTACLASLLTVMLAGGWALAGIEGSKHDFSNEAWSGGDRCGACHSPHRETPPKAAPLWDPNADLTSTFGTPIGQRRAPGRGTMICLRCHDGTIARDSVSGANATIQRFSNKRHPGMFTAGHGTTDHPVGIDYPQFDKGFRPITSVIAQGTVLLPDNKVECSSCHDPHNTSGEAKMLVTSNDRSALCLICHKK